MKFNPTRKASLFFTLTLAWMAVIFLFSAQNGDDSSNTSGKLLMMLCGLIHYNPPADVFEVLAFLIRKAAHMTEFGLLALLWLGTLINGFGRRRWNFPLAFAATSLYAATDELHQLFVSDRAGQVTDWLIDSSGALLYLLLAWIILWIVSKKQAAKNPDKS